MTEDLRRIPSFLALSRATMRVIRQNLFWAFAVKSDQYDDVERPKHRMLDEDPEDRGR